MLYSNFILFVRLSHISVAFDDQICAPVAVDPRNYKVSHPSDCTKFYVCQSLGRGVHLGGTWKAHLMQCPINTGFDTHLMMCNWITNLKQCPRGNVNL